VKEYDGKVRVVYKNFVVHPDTVTEAHLAGCAANKQGKFKAYKNAFWKDGFGKYKATRDPKTMAKDALLALSKKAGLDTTQLAADMESDECKQLIQSEMAELQKFRVGGTPSFFVNGKSMGYRGPGPFKAAIEAELKAVEASGVAAADYYEKEVMGKGSKVFVSASDAKKK